jgi:hypothetical protein
MSFIVTPSSNTSIMNTVCLKTFEHVAQIKEK